MIAWGGYGVRLHCIKGLRDCSPAGKGYTAMQGYGGLHGVVDIAWESKKGYPSQTPQKDNWSSVVVRLVKSFVLSEGARFAGYCERLPRTVI